MWLTDGRVVKVDIVQSDKTAQVVGPVTCTERSRAMSQNQSRVGISFATVDDVVEVVGIRQRLRLGDQRAGLLRCR